MLEAAEASGVWILIEQEFKSDTRFSTHSVGLRRGRKGVIFTVPYITMGGKAQIRA